MELDALDTVDIIEQLENFIDTIRPVDEEIRKKLDFGYNIDNQSIILVQIRPDWKNPQIFHQSPFAKMTYVKASDKWKIYWMRSNGNWDPYEPAPTVKSLKGALEIIRDDKHHAFFG